jgi:small-conductance mechanosensitive channel
MTIDQAWRILQGHTLMGVSVLDWTVFLVVTAGLAALLYLIRGIARKRLAARAERTGWPADAYLAALLERTWTLSLLAASILAALALIELKPIPIPARIGIGIGIAPAGRFNAENAIRIVALWIMFLQLGRWGTSLIDTALAQGFRVAKLAETTAQTAVGVVRFFALAALWTSVAILALNTLEIQVTPLLAGLGVTGIAVAFALQKILGDIFCSVAIVLDRPFDVGDAIQAGDCTGTVERIGIKTTRIRSVGGEQIVFPNSDLLQSRIHNFKRMTERRLSLRFSVAYGTAAATLERIPGLVRACFEALEATRLERAHFIAFGDSGFIFEVVYQVLDPDFNLAMDIQQRINLAVLVALEGLGVRLTSPKP